jgi:hypothetical protein
MPTYSFMDVNGTLNGPGGSFPLGYGSANAKEGIEITMNADKNTMLIGADGEGMHSLKGDKSGTVTLRYLKTSPRNAQLMALYDAQSLSAKLWGQNIITVTQDAVGDIHTAREAAFKKKPDMKYAEEGDILAWTFDCIKIDGLLGTY